jgi:hypothetical protein
MVKCEKCGVDGTPSDILTRFFPSGKQKILCDNCYKEMTTNYTLLGKLSIIFGLISFPGVFLFMLLADKVTIGIHDPGTIYSIVLVFVCIPLVFGCLALASGIVSMSNKDDLGIPGLALGIIGLLYGSMIVAFVPFSLMH